jgi:hypothetical protein
MNPPAVDLYNSHGIDLAREPLEIAVCAQHNNGGFRGSVWWESNVRGLFPVGEVCGTHGVTRPGGSALNAGQVGSLRAAEFIAAVPAIYKIHLFFGMTLFVLFPFSRLVHVWSGFAATTYATRAWQLVRPRG